MHTKKLTSTIEFAAKAHRNQKRKYTGDPYINHPIAVMNIVASVTSDIDMLCAAVLHDVVEDCDVTIDEIMGRFGNIVAAMVSDLTDVSKPEDGNRATRKAIDRAHTAQSMANSKTIKLADLIDNASDISQHDKGFAAVYMAEKKLLLEVLTEGDSELYSRACKVVSDYYGEEG